MIIVFLLAIGVTIIIISIRGLIRINKEHNDKGELKQENLLKDFDNLNNEGKIRILQTAIERPTDMRLADYEKIEVTKERINLIKKGTTPREISRTAQSGIVYLVYPDHIEYKIEIETAIEVLATIWQKQQEKSIALDELAILWRDLHQPKVEQNKDISEQITYHRLKDFYKKYILNNVLYSEGYKKVIDYIIMKLLEFKDTSSIMYGIKEEYRNSDDIARLQFISLIDHTVNVCEILMSRVEPKDKDGPIEIAYIILGLFHDIGKIPILFKTIGERHGHAAASSFDFKDIARANLPEDFLEKIDEAIAKHHTEMESGRNIYYDMLVSADREARRREFSFIQKQIDKGEIILDKDGKYRLKSELQNSQDKTSERIEENIEVSDDSCIGYEQEPAKETSNDSVNNEYEEKIELETKEEEKEEKGEDKTKGENVILTEILNIHNKTETLENSDNSEKQGFNLTKDEKILENESEKQEKNGKENTNTSETKVKNIFNVLHKKQSEKIENKEEPNFSQEKETCISTPIKSSATLDYEFEDITYIKKEEMAFNNALPDKNDDKVTLNKEFRDEFLKNFDFSSQENKEFIDSYKTILNKHIDPKDLLYNIVNHINYSSYKETKTGEKEPFVKSILYGDYLLIEQELLYELLMEIIKEKRTHDYYYLLDSIGKNIEKKYIFSSISISIVENNIKKCLFDEKKYPQCLYKVKFKNTNKNLYDIKMWIIRNFISTKLREKIELRKKDNTVLKRLESIYIIERNKQGIEVVKTTINLT